jgi:hypothetical protein
MSLTKPLRLCGAALTACLLQAPLHAQSGAPSGPAGLPPASFQGTQFVDLEGCVYIRAGFGGTVQWVPRVTRDRRQLCGFEPSFPATAAERSAPAPSGVEVITVSGAPERPLVPADDVPGGKAPASTGSAPVVAQEERFLPEHLARERAEARRVRVPAGYRSAWDDDRLNLRRAEQTRRGAAQTDAIWTRTVPRKLVD